MRQNRFYLLMLLLLPVFLAGCGGGGGNSSQSVGTRTVTVTIGLPASKVQLASGKSSRVLISGIQSIIVEVFDGTVQVAREHRDNLHVGNTSLLDAKGNPVTIPLQLPAKDLTFYVYGYAIPTAPNYNTDPMTGFLVDPTTKQPIVYGTDPNLTPPHPIAQATTTLSGTASNITFTINNTIALLEPMDKDTPTKQATTLTYIPSQKLATVDLNTTIRARASDGSIVMLPANVLKWTAGSDPKLPGNAGDPNTAVESQRASLDTSAFPHVLTIKATGPVHMTVTDNEVNTTTLPGGYPYNQTPISATIDYTIIPMRDKNNAVQMYPFAFPTTTDPTTNQSTLPYYAKSVTFSVIQQPLVGEDLTKVLDNPPMQVSGTFKVTPTYNPNMTAVTSVTVTDSNGNPPAVQFVPTGRNVTLKVQAWSGDNGSGTIVAENTIPTAAAQSNFGQSGNALATWSANVPLNTDITQFDLVAPGDPTPITPTLAIYQNPSGNQNHLPLQLYARVGGSELPLDPRTVSYIGGNIVTTNAATIYFDGSSFLTSPATGPVTIKVKDAIPAFASLPTDSTADVGLIIHVRTPGFFLK